MGTEEYARTNERQELLVPRLESRGVIVLDPVPCLSARSGPNHGIMPGDAAGSFFRDRDHLSTYGAMVLSPLFAPIITANNARGRSRLVITR